MDETTTIQEIRESILDLLNEHFKSLNSQCQMCIALQTKISDQLSKNEKVDRDYMHMLTNLRGQIQETITVILPLLKENIKPPIIIEEDDHANYKITDPLQKQTLDELRTYLKKILAEDKAKKGNVESESVVQQVLNKLEADSYRKEQTTF